MAPRQIMFVNGGSEYPMLWGLTFVRGLFVCLIWHLTPRQYAALSATNSSEFPVGIVPAVGEFGELDSAFSFFAGPGRVRGSQALEFLNRFNADWTPGCSR
jgi:hypothetical protein